MKDRSHDEAMAQYFLKNPTYAEALLADVLRDGDIMERVVLLRQLQGKISESSAVTVSTRWSECE